MNVQAIPTTVMQGRAKAAALLRELADQMDQGEAVAFVGFVERADGTYRRVWSRHVNRLEFMGALFEAACGMADKE